MRVGVEQHHSKTASPEEQDECCHQDDGGMDEAASVGKGIDPRADFPREVPEAEDQQQRTDDEQDPGRQRHPMIETSGISGGDKRPHDDVRHEFGEVEDREPVECKKDERALPRKETMQDVQAYDGEDRVHQERDAPDHGFRHVSGYRKQPIVWNALVPSLDHDQIAPDDRERARRVAEQPRRCAVSMFMKNRDDVLYDEKQQQRQDGAEQTPLENRARHVRHQIVVVPTRTGCNRRWCETRGSATVRTCIPPTH